MSDELSHATLKVRWAEVFGVAPPSRAKADFMNLALAWHSQMQADGAWRGSAGKRRLKSLLRGAIPKTVLSPGTRLVREWQGAVHQVTVLDSGFEYLDKVYSSLSAVARTITGTPWSGPFFFGLNI